MSTERFNQLDSTTKNILDRLLLEPEHVKPDSHMLSPVIVKNASLKMLKSILFMGYALSDMKIMNIVDDKINKGNSQENVKTMEMIREKGFTITYKVLERMKNLKPKGTKVSSLNEFSDLELQYNLFTLSTTIVYLECHLTTKPKEGFSNITIEVKITYFLINYSQDFIDLFLQQLCFDLTTMPMEHLMLHIQATGTLAVLISDDMKFYTKIFRQIISYLTSSLSSLSSKGQISAQKKDLAAELFFVLLV